MIDVLLSYKSSWRILWIYSYSPGRGFYRKELQKLTKLSNMALDNSLAKLIQFGILNKEKRVYRINASNIYVGMIFELIKNIKKELRELSWNNILVLHDFLFAALNVHGYIKGLVLFGSIAKLTSSKNSDFDICVITHKRNMKKKMMLESFCKKVEDEHDLEFQLHYYTEEEFEEGKKRKEPLIEEIIKSGIKII